MSVKDLWVERYRPTKLEDYVWSDDAQKTQVMSWVHDKAIPNLLLSGSAGVGKCLGPNEQITVRLDVSKLSKKQRDILGII
jgi:replication-associated recombination protein RarA